MKKEKLFPAPFALALALAIYPASAAETDWFETDGGNVRVVTEPFLPGATAVRGFIDIDLLPGWKTYWRDPGSGGIPPSIQIQDLDFEASAEIAYPVPKWIYSQYGSYAGYDSPVQIPFTFETDKPLVERNVDARIFIGICKDICIPAFSDFEIPLIAANGSSEDGILVAAAFDALPKPPEAIDVSVSAHLVAAQKIEVEIVSDETDFTLFVSGKDGEQFTQAERLSAEMGKTRFQVKPVDPFDDGQRVDVILTGQSDTSNFETTIPLVFKQP